MKAVKLLGDKKLEVVEIPKPEPKNGEVVVRIADSGICTSDIELLYNSTETVDIIPGHEVSGVVDDAKKAKIFKEGDRVLLNCHSTCGKCLHCKNGDLIFCSQLKSLGFDLDGGDAEFLAVPESMLRILPDDINFESGVIISDSLGTAYHAVKKANISRNNIIGIIGVGSLGLMCVVCAKYFGCSVIAVDIIPERLKLAKRFGADIILNPKECNIREYLKESIKINGLDTVIDFSGSSDAIAMGADLLKPRGKLILVGLCKSLDLDPYKQIISRELIIMGSRNYNNNELDELFTIARQNPFIQDIVTHRFTLSDAEKAFQIAERKEGIKVILTP